LLGGVGPRLPLAWVQEQLFLYRGVKSRKEFAVATASGEGAANCAKIFRF